MTDTPAMADLIQTIDERIRLHLREQQPRVVYGVVDTVDTANKVAAVFLEGEATSSPDIGYSVHEPAAGALVRVVLDPKGDRYIVGIEGAVTEQTLSRLRLTSTGDATTTGTTHGLQIGPTSGVNLIADGNEIMARNNGATDTLYLNKDGGLVHVGGGGLDSDGRLDADLAIAANSNTSEPVTLSGNNYIDMVERAAGAPGNPSANTARIYVDDNAGVTRLRVRMSNGVITTLATS